MRLSKPLTHFKPLRYLYPPCKRQETRDFLGIEMENWLEWVKKYKAYTYRRICYLEVFYKILL